MSNLPTIGERAPGLPQTHKIITNVLARHLRTPNLVVHGGENCGDEGELVSVLGRTSLEGSKGNLANRPTSHLYVVCHGISISGGKIYNAVKFEYPRAVDLGVLKEIDGLDGCALELKKDILTVRYPAVR